MVSWAPSRASGRPVAGLKVAPTTSDVGVTRNQEMERTNLSKGAAMAMNTLPYQQAFDRIRAEFMEMPGMRLTPEQVSRLSGADRNVCKSVLEDLVRAGFLCCLNGAYIRRQSEAAPVSRFGLKRSRL
jgi:hypothetical protein